MTTPPIGRIQVTTTPEMLRLIVDPFRLREQPRTVTELADLLGVPRTRLYEHVKLLESHTPVAVDGTPIIPTSRRMDALRPAQSVVSEIDPPLPAQV